VRSVLVSGQSRPALQTDLIPVAVGGSLVTFCAVILYSPLVTHAGTVIRQRRDAVIQRIAAGRLAVVTTNSVYPAVNATKRKGVTFSCGV
jgi:hypothetical protein